MAKRSVSRRKTPPKAQAKKPAVPQLPSEGTLSAEIRGIRVMLFEASGIIHAVRLALSTKELAVDEVLLQNALEVSRRMVDAACCRLEADHA